MISKKSKLLTSCLSTLMLASIFSTPILAQQTEAPKEVFSLIPDKADAQRIAKIEEDQKNEKVTAWRTDLKGKRTTTKVIPENEFNNAKSSKYNEISPNFTANGFTYVWDSYQEKLNQFDPKRFFISSVSLENKTSSTIAMKYTQQETVTKDWTFTGKVSLENEFGNAILAKAKLAVGAEVARKSTTFSSSTVEYTYNVPPNKRGTISKYQGGEYSGGTGVWKQYTSNYSFIGMYYETGSAWTIVPEKVTYVASEQSI